MNFGPFLLFIRVKLFLKRKRVFNFHLQLNSWYYNKADVNQVMCVLLCFDLACCADDLLGGINVSVLSHVHHRGPAGGDDSSRPGACNRGRGVDSPLPVWSYKVLVVPVLFITVEDHWGTLWCVPILESKEQKKTQGFKPWSTTKKTCPGGRINSYLVGVCWNAGNTFQPEVKGSQWVTGLVHEDDEEPS